MLKQRAAELEFSSLSEFLIDAGKYWDGDREAGVSIGKPISETQEGRYWKQLGEGMGVYLSYSKSSLESFVEEIIFNSSDRGDPISWAAYLIERFKTSSMVDKESVSREPNAKGYTYGPINEQI